MRENLVSGRSFVEGTFEWCANYVFDVFSISNVKKFVFFFYVGAIWLSFDLKKRKYIYIYIL